MKLGKLLTVPEVADQLQVREETVRRYILEGRLRALRIPGGYYRIKGKDLAQFLRPVAPRGRDE